MPCTLCGSPTASCGCDGQVTYGPPLGQGCGVDSVDGPSACGQPAGPQPAYDEAPVRYQNHQKTVVIQQFSAAIKITSSWNVPQCGSLGIVTVAGLISVTIGSYIWHPDYGYFEITAFDQKLNQLTILNHCNRGNAAVGTSVAACTTVIITPPPVPDVPPDAPCVAIDFTAPDVNVPTDITLTSVNNVGAADQAEIGTGLYDIIAVKANNIITIENTGQGIAPGTSVIAKDAGGNYQYCLSIITQDACTAGQVGQGNIVICAGNAQKRLSASLAGQVPMSLNHGSGTVEMVNLDAPLLNCHATTAAVTINPGVVNYSIPVDGTFNIGVGGHIRFGSVIDGGAGLTFTGVVTSIPDSHTYQITLDASPTVSYSLSAGSAICGEYCCDANARIIESVRQNNFFGGYEDAITDSSHPNIGVTSANVPDAVTTHNTPHLTWSITNPNLNRALKVMSVFQLMNDQGQAIGGLDHFWPYISISSILNFKINGGSAQSPSTRYAFTLLASTDSVDADVPMTYSRIDAIAPGATVTFELWGQLTWDDYTPSGGCDNWYACVGTIGVSYSQIAVSAN